MHELSIALSIVDIACEEAERHGSTRVHATHLKLGPLAGVVRESLLSAYELACEGTPLEGSQLVIDEVPGNILQLAALELES
jgi:hydrogenase nickel incorporation protein HypA/HybF